MAGREPLRSGEAHVILKKRLFRSFMQAHLWVVFVGGNSPFGMVARDIRRKPTIQEVPYNRACPFRDFVSIRM